MKFTERTKNDYLIIINLFGYTIEQIKHHRKFVDLLEKYEHTKRDSFSGWALASQLEECEDDDNFIENLPMPSYDTPSAFRALKHMIKIGYSFTVSNIGENEYECILTSNTRIDIIYNGNSKEIAHAICIAVINALKGENLLKITEIEDIQEKTS